MKKPISHLIVYAVILVLTIITTAIMTYSLIFDSLTVFTDEDNTIAWITVFGQSNAYEISKEPFNIQDYNKGAFPRQE